MYSQVSGKKRSYSSQNDVSSRRRLNPKVYRKKAYGSKMSTPMYRQVKAIVDRARETKYRINYVSNQLINVSTPSTYILEGQVNPFVGSASINRIGNKISPVGARFKGVFRNRSAHQMNVRVLYLSVNEGRTENIDLLPDFFEGTSGTDVPQVGTLIDLIRRPNREQFKVLKDETFTLGYESAGYSSPDSTVKYCNYYIKRTGVQTYHDAENEYPDNDRFIVAIIAYRADGTTSDDSISLDYSVESWWKD